MLRCYSPPSWSRYLSRSRTALQPRRAPSSRRRWPVLVAAAEVACFFVPALQSFFVLALLLPNPPCHGRRRHRLELFNLFIHGRRRHWLELFNLLTHLFLLLRFLCRVLLVVSCRAHSQRSLFPYHKYRRPLLCLLKLGLVNLVFLFTYLVRPPEFIKVVLVLPRGLFLYGMGIWFVEVCALCLQRSRHLAPMPPFSSYFWSTPSSTPPARVGFARRAHLDWRSTRIWVGGQRAQYQWYGGPTQIGGSHQLRSRAFCRQICRQSQSRPFSPEIGLCRFWIPIATGIRMRQVGKSSEAHIGPAK